jgi:peptidoglycan/xylan/chitin deacetylase (PgdA/CDA1 family)
MYHRFGFPKPFSLVAGQYVAPPLLVSQINCLKANLWQPVNLDDIIIDRTIKPENSKYAITFDDGYLSVYDKAFPVLAARGITGTVYVVADQVGGINQWDRAAGDYLEHMMNADQIREMHRAGFGIGSHTLSHPHLTQISDDELRAEVFDSKKSLEDVIGEEVRSFSYPYGDYDDRVRNVVIEAGYTNAVSTRLGVVLPTNGAFDIPRLNVRWNTFGFALMQKIRRAVRRSLESGK